ncbi:MAG: MlaD family protein [Pseudomonadota bacterium]
MSKPANKTVIGVFVIVAIGLVVGAILILGSGRFFRHYPKYVMYFESSVKGLSIGSPVVFRGVKVGSVTDIAMDFNPSDLSILIPVYVELGEETVNKSSQNILERDRTTMQEEYTQALIKKGLRAQLEIQSVVTGQLLIDLEFHPATKADFTGRDKRYAEIPTIPTQFQQLTKRLENVPIEEILQELRATLAGIHKMVNSPEAANLTASVSKGAEEARLLIQHIDKQVRPLAGSTNKAVQQIKNLAENMNKELVPLSVSIKNLADETGVTLRKSQAAFDKMDSAVGDDSALAYQLPKTLKELEGAARSIRLLANELRQQPEAVVWGKKKAKGE